MFHVGDVVRKLRRERHVTLEALSKKSGLSKTTLSNLERTGANFERGTLQRVAVALHVTEAEIYTQLESLLGGMVGPTKPAASSSDTDTGADQGSSEQTESGMTGDPQVDKLVSVFKGLPAADRQEVWLFVLEKELARTRVRRGRTGERKKRRA